MNFYQLSRGLSKRLYAYFSFHARNVLYRRKIKKEIKFLNCPRLTTSQILEIKTYYLSFGFKNICTDWHRYYTHLYGKFYKEFIPEDLFYNIIEPNLNRMSMTTALTDKNLLKKLFKGVKQPKTVVKNINGYFFSGDSNEIISFTKVVEICNKFSKLIIKPSIGSFGGKGIIVFSLDENKTNYKNMSVGDLINLYGDNFIIQKIITQHNSISRLNPSSVNTLRIRSLLINNKVEILENIIRFGKAGAEIDNTSQGGIYCRIKSTGYLGEKGYLGNGEFILKTDANITLKDFKINNYDNILERIENLHIQMPYFKLISWDIAFDINEDLILIEFNVEGQGIRPQVTYGPLFGKFTNQILENIK